MRPRAVERRPSSPRRVPPTVGGQGARVEVGDQGEGVPSVGPGEVEVGEGSLEPQVQRVEREGEHPEECQKPSVQRG